MKTNMKAKFNKVLLILGMCLIIIGAIGYITGSIEQTPVISTLSSIGLGLVAIGLVMSRKKGKSLGQKPR